jgi:hypothetical protein
MCLLIRVRTSAYALPELVEQRLQPGHYALELNRLIELQMGGAVG